MTEFNPYSTVRWYQTATVVPPGYKWSPHHAPALRRDCADADRAADEQIDMLVEDLGKPCPHCGKRRDA